MVGILIQKRFRRNPGAPKRHQHVAFDDDVLADAKRLAERHNVTLCTIFRYWVAVGRETVGDVVALPGLDQLAPKPPGRPRRDDSLDRVFAMIEAAAEAGNLAPTNGEIAVALGLKKDDSAAKYLGRLVKAGRLRVAQYDGRRRVLEIVATGKRTADLPTRQPEPATVKRGASTPAVPAGEPSEPSFPAVRQARVRAPKRAPSFNAKGSVPAPAAKPAPKAAPTPLTALQKRVLDTAAGMYRKSGPVPANELMKEVKVAIRPLFSTLSILNKRGVIRLNIDGGPVRMITPLQTGDGEPVAPWEGDEGAYVLEHRPGLPVPVKVFKPRYAAGQTFSQKLAGTYGGGQVGARR